MRESDIEKYLVKRLKQSGAEVRKLKWIGRRGAPDRVVLYNGLTVWVEVKAPGEKLEPHQEREHARMSAAGQILFTIDSLDGAEEVIDYLANGDALL